MKELRKDTDTPIEQMDTTSKCEQPEPPTFFLFFYSKRAKAQAIFMHGA